MGNKGPSRWYKFVIIATLGLAGCDEGKFPVRPASGSVVSEGQPVTSGSITFTPLGGQNKSETGKAATGAIGPDGNFKLSTFGRFDGAIVGKHRVQYTGSEGEDTDDSDGEDEDAPDNKPTAKSNKPILILDEDLIFEVNSSGSNIFKIELTKKKNRRSRDGS